ncbi:MAG: hypothetical protein JW839_04455 [Candidatus Lokiarchaeota archaeon]|nr:hypothetical protein [Candidatus Lokiarchaeota archaeon]
MIHIPGRKVRNRKEAREDAGVLICFGTLMIVLAWVLLPGFVASPTDAMIASIAVSAFGGMVVACGIYLLVRSREYPEAGRVEPGGE